MLLPIAAGAGALVFAGFHSMLPKSQLYGRTFLGEAPGSRRLALTFDDGPSDSSTLRLLDILAKHAVRATFFVIGKAVERHPNVLREVVAAGHEIGNHTYSHPNLIFRSATAVRGEISACAAATRDAAGVDTKLFRPPWGGRLPGTLCAIRDAAHEPVMWSASSYDWRATSADQIVDNLVRQIRGGEVILLHDGDYKRPNSDRSLSVQATDEVVRRYRGEGFEFVTVSQMLAAPAHSLSHSRIH
jgi:peptidoglycan/xylan/chitin deacetylase (PgdA/CDA1 family)